MKKLLFFCMILLLLFSSNVLLYCNKLQGDAEYNWAVTIKSGYFYPQEKILRNIFDRCGGKGGYWLEGAVRYNIFKYLDIEASGSYFNREGRALYGNECTKVKIPTIGFGLKYFFTQIDFYNGEGKYENRWSFFLGSGLRVFFYRENNTSPFVLNCVKKTTVGGMVNLGFEFRVWKKLFLDLFMDYNVKKLHLNRKNLCNSSYRLAGDNCLCFPSCTHDIHLGGLVSGIGLGYSF